MAPFEALYWRRCRTLLCWFESGESALLGPDVVQETAKKVKMIQEKMKVYQRRQKIYHDKKRKDIEFQVGDHVFLRVNLVTGVGRALKCRKSTPRFVGPFELVEKIGVVAYQIALPPSLSNLHDVFHVSQLRKYVYDDSHVIQVDELEVRDNLTVETWPVRVEDREMKRLRGKLIILVKVIWVGPTSESATWESESRMKDLYPELSPSGKFRGRKFF